METQTPLSDTRERLLDLAYQKVLLRGFNEVSFQNLADEIGIRKASIHYYFRTKEDLGVALLERIEEQFLAWADRWSTRTESPKARIVAFFRMIQKLVGGSDQICPTGTFSAAFTTLPEAVQKALQQFHLIQREWILTQIKEGRKQGEFSTKIPLEAQVDLFMSTVQGAIQIARLRKDPQLLASVSQQLLTLLGG